MRVTLISPALALQLYIRTETCLTAGTQSCQLDASPDRWRERPSAAKYPIAADLLVSTCRYKLGELGQPAFAAQCLSIIVQVISLFSYIQREKVQRVAMAPE